MHDGTGWDIWALQDTTGCCRLRMLVTCININKANLTLSFSLNPIFKPIIL